MITLKIFDFERETVVLEREIPYFVVSYREKRLQFAFPPIREILVCSDNLRVTLIHQKTSRHQDVFTLSGVHLQDVQAATFCSLQLETDPHLWTNGLTANCTSFVFERTINYIRDNLNRQITFSGDYAVTNPYSHISIQDAEVIGGETRFNVDDFNSRVDWREGF